MSHATSVGLIGCGGIAQDVVAALRDAGRRTAACALSGALARRGRAETARAKLCDIDDCRIARRSARALAPRWWPRWPGSGRSPNMARRCCAAGSIFLVISVGALADPALLARLKAAAQRRRQPHPAAGRRDRRHRRHRRHAGRRPHLGALSLAQAARRLARLAGRDRWPISAALTERTVLYRGTAGEAALRYPQNANVAAAVALAGLGFDATEVELVADPDAPGNVHEIEAEGAAGRFAIQLAGQAVALESEDLGARRHERGAGAAQRTARRSSYDARLRAEPAHMDQKRTTNTFVGSPVERLEDLRFLRGRGQFVDDVAGRTRCTPSSCAARSRTAASASIDARAALARPGVHAVITAADIGEVPVITMRQELLPAFKPYQQPVIARDKVRYVGEPIAVVVAESAGARRGRAGGDRARHRAAAGGRGSRRGAPRTTRCCSRRPARNRVITLTALKGDAEAAFRDAGLRPPRAFLGAALHRRADGAARPARRMGRAPTAPHRPRRHQGAVPQPPHPGQADGAAGGRRSA